MRKLLVLGVSLLALAACQKPAEKGAPPTAGSESTTAPAGSPASAAPLTATEAFRMAFGAAAPAVRKVTDETGTETTYSYSPGKLVPLADDEIALISTATSASDCHACSGALAVHYFKRDGAGWKLAGSWPELLPGNGFGAAPDWTIRQDLGRPNYLVTEAGWTGQGYTCSSTDVVALQADKPVVLGENIPLHYDNEGVGTPPVVNIDGKLDRGPDGKLRVTFSGSRSGFTDYEIVDNKLHRVSDNVIDDC